MVVMAQKTYARGKAETLASLRATKEDRRVLEQRPDRCERLAVAQIEDRLERSGVGTRGIDRRDYVGDALYAIRAAEQNGKHLVTVSEWREGGGQKVQFFAMRTSRGVVWDACRFSGGVAPCSPFFGSAPLRRGEGDWRAWARDPRRGRVQCPCTDREMVAIDALLERGDKQAAKLAVACRRGGGALQGTSKKRRRK